ncbi:conjugal transfer protein TraO [Parabacteroides massiliensis]|uniref:conjugal transfer protein TraO n=1 Tax=Parabacteroides massiliensis TaxID=1750560 RepID=UPI00096A41F8|nr:conjugal transfer protein TraO [Parabacteroides massiliensis]
MEHLRLIVISVTLLLCAAGAFAQRHYENISALDVNYGTSIFGDADNYCGFSFSKYINRKSYWKAGLGYFEKSYEYILATAEPSGLYEPGTAIGKGHDKGKDFYVDGGYYRTLASNLKSVYWGIGLGGFIGTEYVRHPDKEYSFIIGPKLETELEVFILPQAALLARIQQHWNPLSIDKWNTVWNVGIKLLLY